MEQVCRTCTSTSVNLIDIFDEQHHQEEEELSLAEMLNECVSSQIIRDDQLPKQICLACILAAQNAFRFKRRCEESHQHFHQLLDEKEKAGAHREDWPFAECGTKTEDSKCEPIPQAVANVDVQEYGGVRIDQENSSGDIKDEHESSGKKRRHLCDYCGKVFLRSAHLERHIRVHSGERPYKCVHCPNAFAQRRSLEDHVRLHNGELPYKCSRCSKAFNSPSNLKSHERIHSGERPYQCPHCPKSFIQGGCLQTHLRVHTGERPYKCPQCPKDFINNASLHNHTRIHSGERPYKCPQCPKAFPRKETLQNHILLHSGERPYKCADCSKDFFIRGGLQRHIRKHHSYEIPTT